MSDVTDIHQRQDAGADDAEVDRLVLKGLRAPLTTSEAARLNDLAAGSQALAARADRLIQTWTMAGVLNPRRIAGDGVAALAGNRRWLLAAAAAAAAAPVAVWLGAGHTSSTTLYQAPDDASLHVALADASRAVLSRGGRMEVRLTSKRRDIRLLAGEALYTVAKDARRPFAVAVGQHRLTVLGTQFNVDPRPQGLRVDLLEGSLKVEQTGSMPYVAVLKPGERYWAGHSQRIAVADVAASAAWVDGRLVFDDAPLKEVAQDLVRQTGRTLTFAEPRLAALRFSGVLRLDQAQDWQAGLEAVLPIHLSPTGNGYRVSHS